ncbi:MAG: SLC13 family permease [Myxococcota bacterium]
MSAEAWLTVGVVAAMVLALARGLAGPDMVLTAGLALLLALGILEPGEAFLGFANPALVTIGALFVVAAGVRETGALDLVGRWVLGRPRALAGAQLRVMLPVSTLSAFLNNTPVVAMFVPLVERWARRHQLPASMLLMPLSYAAILGGTCTLIGTSTNLVVAGMVAERHPNLSLGMFDVAAAGVPVLLAGTLYVLLASPRLLKGRLPAAARFGDQRAYTVALRVERGSPVAGQTIEEAGLRALEGLFLYDIERDGQLLLAPPPTTVLRDGDILRFTGRVETVVDLRRLRLMPATEQVSKLGNRPGRRWVEAVVAAQSPLAGATVKASRFRTRFNAAILAVHRQGERVSTKVGDIALQPGDVLLIEAHPSFVAKHRRDPAFALVSEVEGSVTPRHERARLAAALLVAMVVLNVAGVLPLVTAALLAAGAMLWTRCLTGTDARRSLDLQVLVTVGSALGIGRALDASGAAAAIGEALLVGVAPYGASALLGAVFLATAALAGVAYTTTAAALMYPVAATVAASQGLPPESAAYVVMLAASTAFSTPVGYAANLMVYGPGGYRFGDFLRLGLPLQLLVGAITVTVVRAIWG